jgi:hypothetical protein
MLGNIGGTIHIHTVKIPECGLSITMNHHYTPKVSNIPLSKPLEM